MHFVVVDPRLLVQAFQHPDGRAARLLALLAFGSVCFDANGQPLDEADEADRFARRRSVDPSELAALHAYLQRVQDEAVARKELMEHALEQHVPDNLLLVTSPPLRSELLMRAQRIQGRGHQHVEPHLVSRQISRWTATALLRLDPAPFYLGAGRVSEREYLIHTAIVGEADTLITDDKRLWTVGDLRHIDPRTKRSVRPYSLADFVEDVIPSYVDFDAIEARAVLRAGTCRLLSV